MNGVEVVECGGTALQLLSVGNSSCFSVVPPAASAAISVMSPSGYCSFLSCLTLYLLVDLF